VTESKKDNLFNKHPVDKLLVIILSGAFILRASGIFYGAAEGFHPDEGKYILMALQYGKEGLNPHYFVNPSLFSYLLFTLYSIQYVIFFLLSIVQTPLEYLRYYLLHSDVFLVEARLLSVLAGTGTVYCVYRLGNQIGNKKIGYAGSILCTVSFIMVRESHFAVPDALATFLMTTSLVLYFNYLQGTHKSSFYLSGLILGLAVAAKYTVALMFFPILLQMMFFPLNKDKKHYRTQEPFIYMSIIFLGFFIGCPYAFLSWRELFSGLNELSFFSHHGWFGIDYQFNSLSFYLDTLNWGIGLPALVFLIASIPMALFIEKKIQINMMAWFILAYLLFLSFSQLRFERFILPIIPFSTVLISWMVFQLIEKYSRPKSYFLLIMGILIIYTSLGSLYFDYLLHQKDTRTLAQEWIEENIPPGSKIALDGYGPPISLSNNKLFSLAGVNIQNKFKTMEMGRFGLALHPLEFYRVNGYNYLITSSYTYGKFSGFGGLFDEEINQYSQYDSKLKLIKTFVPIDNNSSLAYHNSWIQGPGKGLLEFDRPGPVIKIYQVIRE